MRIAVLFDGAGLARYGLEQAGHECTGYELDPAKHYLSQFIGSGNCVLADATQVDLSGFDAIWNSPPCQGHSSALNGHQKRNTKYSDETLLRWALNLTFVYKDKPIWVENVLPQGPIPDWGTLYNAAQFLPRPIQLRSRVIGGRYKQPMTYRSYARLYERWNICPAITATEYKAGNTRRASRWYGRRLTIEECASHQGLDHVPDEWYEMPEWYAVPEGKTGSRAINWRNNLYEAIGNGVPVYMAKAFGDAYNPVYTGPIQLELF